MHGRRNDEIHVTDFGGSDSVLGLGRAAEAVSVAETIERISYLDVRALCASAER